MIIRHERPADCEAISRLQYAAFKDHPQHAPGAEPTEHRIVELLRTAGDLSLSLVSEDDAGRINGHVALSPSTITTTSGTLNGWYLLGPVGVLPEAQRQGIGSALVRAALAWARKQSAAGIGLVGDPAYYERFGFASSEGLTFPGVPSIYVLAVAFDGDVPEGELGHHPAFHEAI